MEDQRPIFVKGEASAQELQRRLFEYYNTQAAYFSAAEAGAGNRFHASLRPLVLSLASERGTLRILELGAGRTTFRSWLDTLGINGSVWFCAQDVTEINREHLERVADEVFIGELTNFKPKEKFDIVVSTFVYEHVVFPRIFLDSAISILNKGGALVIFSPKYCIPFYVPPAVRHLSFLRRHAIAILSCIENIMSNVIKQPSFRIIRDPAVFHEDFFADADAVHLVHPIDARIYLRGRAKFESVHVKRLSIKDYLWQVLALNAQVFRKISAE